MKQLWFIPVFIFFGIFGSSAQSLYEIKQSMDFFNSATSRSAGKTTLTEADIQGSPYLNDEFIKGAVFTTSKTQFVDVPLRYNIFSDQLEFRTDNGQVLALAAPEVVEKVEFGEYHLEYIPFLEIKKIRRGFFVILEKGRATLYSRPRVLFEEAEEPAAYQDAKPARFVKRPDEYYIRIGKDPAKLIAKRKDLDGLFPDHKKEMASFIKKNKVKPNKPETLKELILFYNSL